MNFTAKPDAKVNTTWAVIGFFIVVSFGAGVWATWMSLQMEWLKTQVSEIRDDLHDMQKPKSLTRQP